MAQSKEFFKDKKVWDIKDQFMFGKSILVAPVVNAQYTPEKIVDAKVEEGWIRADGTGSEKDSQIDFTQKKYSNVYLPAGSLWYDFWSNETLDGGQEISKETTIDIVPLYIRAGSILPIGPNVQYATEKNWDNLELRIYEGENGEFTLYEDENDNYNYEKGVFSTITFSWNDAKNVLTIQEREGSFPGMLKQRKFNIVKLSKSDTGGAGTRVEKEIVYRGKKTTVKL